MTYKAIITKIGALALDFLSDRILVIFNENAPEDLAEISVLHTIEKVPRDIREGDVFIISNKEYPVTAVGDEANKTFKSMGHCTLKFTGSRKADLPGYIVLKGDEIPDIHIGDTIEVKYNL